ncbi:MAG: hypothetical protein MUO26_00290 [Methanotrichaceae archaeon]|nr:hypothetical protein [Methanotrichaceae archaeon]
MKIEPVLFLLLTVMSASCTDFGFSDKVTVGPFSASFNMSNKENLTINTREPLTHDEFNEYGFKIMTGPSKRELIDVVIDDYNNSTDVSETSLMALITDRVASQSYKATWGRVNIGSIPGMGAKIRSPGKSSYIAAYSPDGLNDTGRTIVFIQSFAAQDVTDSFLRDLQIMRVS